MSCPIGTTRADVWFYISTDLAILEFISREVKILEPFSDHIGTSITGASATDLLKLTVALQFNLAI